MITGNNLHSFEKKYLKGLAHNLKPFVFIGARGRNRTGTETKLRGILSAEILKFKIVVISTGWFYSTFLTNFWFRLEMFGNIWPWRAQFGHNIVSSKSIPATFSKKTDHINIPYHRLRSAIVSLMLELLADYRIRRV